jgi:Rrf2 family protein
MRLSLAAYYALQALVHLARKGPGAAPVTSQAIAAEWQLPERFLPKVLKPLVSAQILLSAKGPNGGYRLARPAAKVTLLEVVEAVDGPIRGQVPLRPAGPDAGLRRRLGEVCGELAGGVRKALGKVRLSDLVEG